MVNLQHDLIFHVIFFCKKSGCLDFIKNVLKKIDMLTFWLS